jgi:hypothetical protein
MVRRPVFIALTLLAVLFASAPAAQAAPITINIPQVSGGFEHGVDYVWGIAGITPPAGEVFTSVTLKVLNFANYEYHAEDYIRFGFVQNYTGALGWSTRSSAPASTDIFWTLSGVSASPSSYGPQAIPSVDLSYLGTKFGIYLDPNCHYYGSLQLTYETGPKPPPVPEPASLTLLGLGLAGAAAARRRRD